MIIIIENQWAVDVTSSGDLVPYRWVEKMSSGKSIKDLKPTGEWEWKSELKYFRTMPELLKYIISVKVYKKDLKNLKEVLEAFKETAKNIEEIGKNWKLS